MAMAEEGAASGGGGGAPEACAAALAGGGGSTGGGDWAEMLPEALARIFSLLPLDERMLCAPAVCRSWRKASLDPACWRLVDLLEWSRLSRWELIHKMVELVIDRSAGQIEELSVCRVMSDEPVHYIARRKHSLKVLRIPFCQVSDFCIRNIAPSLRCVTHLDISGCGLLTKVALHLIGQSCKALTRLDRNMSFFNNNNHSLQPDEYDDEALAIAKHMPLLKHLELCYGSLSKQGLIAILNNCKLLSFLDLRGCINLEIDDTLAERCKQLQIVYKAKFSDEFGDFMSDLQDDVFSDYGWDIEEWYSSCDDIEHDEHGDGYTVWL